MRQAIIFRAMVGVLLGSLVLMGAWREAEDKMEGEVSRVDSSSGKLTLADGKQLAVDLGTLVRKDGSVASLSDIKEGDKVRASFSPSIAWMLGQKDAVQSRVKQVVATSQASGAHTM
jgi:Cu/Ag efflux protein CusF